MQLITKTTYLQFLSCAKNAWLQLHRPDLREMFALSDFDKALVAKGNLVESWARKLFPEAILIDKFGPEALELTNKYLLAKKSMFQAAFVSGKFLARNDVLEYDAEKDAWNLYEIKGTNTLDQNNDAIDHIEDAAFQLAILEDNAINVGTIYLIHLNKEYVRGDELDINSLFIKEDITEEVFERLALTRDRMIKAEQALLQTDEKVLSCLCVYKGRSNHCSTFSYSHPEVGKYSVHDLSRIGLSKNKLIDLVDSSIYDIKDVPDDFKLSPIQQNQKDVYLSGIPIIELDNIQAEMDSLVFPLYFLDYETYPPAIPLFKGFKPYQHVPFQFSLHVLEDKNGELKHFEYLHTEASDPSLGIIQKLVEYIGPSGSIIVWNKNFEQKINSELAARHPEYQDFLFNLNDRVYDLIDIFKKQMFVHPGFKGKTSIKSVLPVLAPDLSYKDLEIQNGGSAMEAWFDAVFSGQKDAEKKKVYDNLLKYCSLDTYAMYVIWKHLINIL